MPARGPVTSSLTELRAAYPAHLVRENAGEKEEFGRAFEMRQRGKDPHVTDLGGRYALAEITEARGDLQGGVLVSLCPVQFHHSLAERRNVSEPP
jgi:hypothetical protein